MSLFYYAEKRMSVSGTRLVHNAGCPNLPEARERIFLGSFLHMGFAFQAANIWYFRAGPCLLCLARHRRE